MVLIWFCIDIVSFNLFNFHLTMFKDVKARLAWWMDSEVISSSLSSRLQQGRVLPGDGGGHCCRAEESQSQFGVWSVLNPS